MIIPIPLLIIAIFFFIAVGYGICALMVISKQSDEIADYNLATSIERKDEEELKAENIRLKQENFNLKRIVSGDQLSELEDEQ